MRPLSASITGLLVRWGQGEPDCLNQLLPLVYAEMHRIARRYMRAESPGHTLQATAIVNEAYIRLAHQVPVNWQNRAHFFALAARIMRHILVDHARTSLRGKRGGDMGRLRLDEALVFSPTRPAELIALDEALTRLSSLDARKAQVVELRYFGGMSVDETARLLQVSPNTIIRDWRLAKVWLKRELNRSGDHAG